MDVPTTAHHPDPEFQSLLDLAAGSRPVDWLWPGWIPRRMLTLLAAAPGAGKSLVALDIARRVIAGLPFPDGAPALSPAANVLLVDAEGPLSLLDQRARAWGLDRSRLFLMQHQGEHVFDLAGVAQQKVLIRMVKRLQPPLLIIDSLGAARPGGESGRLGLDLLLNVLPRLAEYGNLALLLIHHLRKRAYSPRSPAPVTSDDLRGSSFIVATARSVLALSPAPPDPRAGVAPEGAVARRLEVVKSNLCRLPPPLGLLLEGGSLGAPNLRYTGPLLPPPPVLSRLDECARWLLDHLAAAGQPVRPIELLRAATAAGFSQATLYRARAALGPRLVELGTGPYDPARRWALAPAPELPATPTKT